MIKHLLALIAAVFVSSVAYAADPPVSPTLPGCYYTASPSTLSDGTIGYMLCDSGHRLVINGGANVVGPATSTDKAIVRFNGTTGTSIQNSLLVLSDANVITADAGSSEFRFGNTAGSGGNGILSASGGFRIAQGVSGIWSSVQFILPNNSIFSWSSTSSSAGTIDLSIQRGGAGILEQYVGTSAQIYNIYNTRTDASNYERGGVGWNACGNIAANVLVFGSCIAGTGAARDIYIQSSSRILFQTNLANNRWIIDSTPGNFSPATDIAVNIGDATHRVLNVISKTLQTGFAYSAAGTALPTCNAAAAGTVAQVSDATAPTYHTNYTSGGAVNSPVYCNGANWLND